MVEWNVSTMGKPPLSLRTPDGFVSVSQLERTIAASPRPYVLISERELSVLRRGLTKDGWKRSLYLQDPGDTDDKYVGIGILSIANRWLDREVQIPARSGYYHNFFCDCGARLSVPGDRLPRKEYACSGCSKKHSGEKYDGAVRYMRHNQLAGAALTLALVYGIEKDKAYADKAAEILRMYAEAYPGPHTDNLTGGMMYQSLDEAVWVIPLAQAYDLIYYSRSLNDDDKRLIEDRLLKPVAEGLKNAGTAGNWGSWHLSAVGVIGLAIKDASLVQFALGAFRLQISDQLGDDGLWPESVHTYHFYPLAAFVFLAEACFRAGIDIYNWEVRPGKSLKLMFTAPLQYMYPSFQLPATNDGWCDSWLPLDLYEIANRRWDDPGFVWALKKGYKFGETPINEGQRRRASQFSRTSFYAFLFGRDLPGRSGVPVLKSSDFDHYGLCTLRSSDDVMVTFDYGPFMGHGHLDKFGFTLYANDSVLVADYGTPGYGSGILDWYKSTAAHNTVVVDGKSQERAADYSLTARYCGAFSHCVEGVARDIYPGVTHTRRIMLVGNVCIVSDVLTSEQEHDYDWLIRCEGAPEPADGLDFLDIDLSAYPLVDFKQTSRFAGRYEANWQCGKGSLAFAAWDCSAEGAIAVGECPAETAGRAASMLLCRKHGRDARFLAALVPLQPGESVEFSRDRGVLSITTAGKADHIYMRSAEGEFSTDLRTDGEYAAVRIADGAVVAVALAGGSRVEWKGELLVECPSAVDCVEVSFEDRSPVVRYCGGEAGVVKLRTHARAMRINGHRVAATNSNGHAVLRITPQLLAAEPATRI